MTTEIRFRLAIPAEQIERYYQGVGKAVLVTAENGQRVRFPANQLQPFIQRQGVYGYFSLIFNADHKFMALKKLNE